MAKLTEAQRRVLDVFADEAFTVRGRGSIAEDRPELPYTIGLRDAFDWLLAQGFIEPKTEYVITPAGRAALENADDRALSSGGDK